MTKLDGETTPLISTTTTTTTNGANGHNYSNEEGRIALDDGTIPGVVIQRQEKQADEEEEWKSFHHHHNHKRNSNSCDRSSNWNLNRLIRILGPGIMVCLADTDGPCLLTAAQSGSQYKYSLVACQIFLIPVLYAAQELTARLAVCSKQGLTFLIQESYGSFWAWFAVTMHVGMCWVGQASEFGAMGQLYYEAFGLDRRFTNTVQFCLLCVIVLMGRLGYRLTEICGMVIGSLQLVFVGLMFVSQVRWSEVVEGLKETHFEETNYEILLAGNIGAVIMPWMLYYQQSAVCERKLKREDLPLERVDTIIGAVLAQLVMASMVIGMGSLRFYGPTDSRSSLNFGDIIKGYAQSLSGTTWGQLQPGATSILDIQPTPDPFSTTVEQQTVIMESYERQIETWYTPESYNAAKWITVLGVSGACTVASMVLSITSVWSVTEILHLERDLFKPFTERPIQYFIQFGGLVVAYAICMCSDISQPWFAVLTQTINGLLILPVALFLWLLASSPKVLPRKYRLCGWYKWTLAFVFTIICAYCIYGMMREITNPI